MAISRGQDVQVRIFKASTGQLVRTINAISFDANEDATVERQKRLGTRSKPVRKFTDGWSGTIGFEVEDSTVDDLVDEGNDAYEAGEPDFKIEIFEAVYYPNTRTRVSYIYPGAMFTLSSSAGDQDSPVTKTLNWTSEARRRV